jgi:hypothetical protein
MPRRTKTKTEPFDYFRGRDALREQYGDLIEKAGIATQIERCERWAAPDYFEAGTCPLCGGNLCDVIPENAIMT